MNRCITVLQTAPLPLGYAAISKLQNVLKKRNQVKPQCCGTTVNLPRRSPKNKSSPHGGVLRIAQKGLYVRITVAMVPFHLHHLPFDAPLWKAALPYGFKCVTPANLPPRRGRPARPDRRAVISAPSRLKCRRAGVAPGGVQFLLDSKQLIVLCEPVGSRERSTLYLAASNGYGKVGDRGILGLTRAV